MTANAALASIAIYAIAWYGDDNPTVEFPNLWFFGLVLVLALCIISDKPWRAPER